MVNMKMKLTKFISEHDELFCVFNILILTEIITTILYVTEFFIDFYNAGFMGYCALYWLVLPISLVINLLLWIESGEKVERKSKWMTSTRRIK